MALDFIPLNENDTKNLRKEIGLPITKDIIYWRQEKAGCWQQLRVTNYEVVATYEPSGTKSILITLQDGSKVPILGDYLAEMQKVSKTIAGTVGQRIEKNIDSYVVVDLETTGTNHMKDEITEIGAIKYEQGKEVKRFEVLVKTEVEIPKKVEKLTGISNDMLRFFGLEPKEAFEQFRSFVGDCVIVGHNFTSFDSCFLEDAYVKEFDCHFPNDYIDTLYLARKELPDLKKHTLESLSEWYGIDYSKAHRAIEDCAINHMVYELLMNGQLQCEDTDFVEVNIAEGWQTKLYSQFAIIEKEFCLKEHSLSIMANIGKDGKESSYAICVYEPDLVEDRKDPSRNTVLARVKEDVLKSNANIVEVSSKNFTSINDKKRFEKDSDELIACIKECIHTGLVNYIPKASGFACCSRYQECSDAKKCIHPNVLYAKACQYRKNLEEGNIFY